jgi:hypothetical protein
MASNEVEVLDPTATVEKMKKIVSGVVVNRRHFMAALGAAGVAAGTGLVTEPAARAQALSPPGFSQVDVLNFLLLVKYLTATYISFVTQGADLPSPTLTTAGSGSTYGTGQIYNQITTAVAFTGTNAAQITDMFNEMYYDEVNDLVALRNLIINQSPAGTPVGETAVCPRPTMNLAGTSAANATFAAPAATMTQTGPQVIAQARMLKDLSVTAFTNALQYLSNGPTTALPTNGQTLATVAQILAVEGFHAAALRLATIQTGAPFQSSQSITSFQVGSQAGSTTLYAISTLSSSLALGQPISGTGIPSGAIVTAFNSAAAVAPTGVVIKGSTTVTAVSSVSGLFAGQPITGTQIPALTYVTAVGTNTITLSQAPVGTVNPVAPTGYLTAGSTTVTGASSVSGINVGQPITGPTISFAALATSGSTTLASVTNLAGLAVGQIITGTATFAAMTTSGSNQLTSVFFLPGTGAAVGQPISGTGIPSGATITAINAGAQTITMSASATATSTAGVTVTTTVIPAGTTITATSPTVAAAITPTVSNAVVAYTVTMSASALATSAAAVTATVIPAGTTVTAASGTNITMSAAALGSTYATTTGVVTNLGTTVTALTSNSGLIAGQVITGAGIPSGTTIKTITGLSLTQSKAATATSSFNTVPFPQFNGVVIAGSNMITQVQAVSGSLVAGLPLSGTGIAPGTVIVSYNSGTATITMSAPATASSTVSTTANTFTGSNVLTTVYSIAGFIVGQPITGAFIPSGTTITAITGSNSTITMSQNALGNTGTAVETITSYQVETILAGGEVLFSPTTGTVNIPAAQAMSIGKSTLTISLPASLSASTTAIIVNPDPIDVAPADPGSAAAAAAGPSPDIAWKSTVSYSVGQIVSYGGVYYINVLAAPALNLGNVPSASTNWQVTSSSPIVYQGFFATAGTGNATGSTPPGFAYARTFSQVLGVLFASTAPGTFDGGFYPVALSGYGYAIAAVSSA